MAREGPQPSRWDASPKLWEKLKPLARQKRHEPTEAEDRLWQRLRNRQIEGVKFRRQYPIERFIVDFFANSHELVIEVDGPIHAYTVEEDAVRQAFLESLGMRVVRFNNDEVMGDIEGVIERIRSLLKQAG